MHATASLGSLLRESMMRAKAGPRKATVCRVLRTRVTLHPDLISLSANRPANSNTYRTVAPDWQEDNARAQQIVQQG